MSGLDREGIGLGLVQWFNVADEVHLLKLREEAMLKITSAQGSLRRLLERVAKQVVPADDRLP